MVGQAVQKRRGHALALEDLAPLAEGQVARHQDAAALEKIIGVSFVFNEK